MDRFELQGIVYYQQGRKCGKADCACASGELHGPYWYARDVSYNKVSYLGKELPGNVARARQALKDSMERIKDLRDKLDLKMQELVIQAYALRNLAAGYRLTKEQTDIVVAFKLKKCLVSDDVPDRAHAQHKTEMATA